MAATAVSRRRGAFVVVVVVVVADAASLAGLVLLWAPTALGSSPTAAVLQLVETGALVMSGAMLFADGMLRPLAIPFSLLAVLSVGPLVVAWQDGPEALRAAAVLLLPFAGPLLLAIVSHGSEPTRGRKATIVVVSALTAVLTGIVAVTHDPFRSPVCSLDCTVRLLAIAPSSAVAAVTAACMFVLVAASAGIAWMWVLRGLRASGPAPRPRVLAMSAPAALALVALAVPSGFALANPGSPASLPAASCILLALGAGWYALRARRRRRAVRSLARRLLSAPRMLRDDLADRLDDPGLEVVYCILPSGRFVSGDGADAPALAPDRAAVALTRGEDLIAVVHVRAAAASSVAGEIGAAARLAIDNERLQASLNARLRELTASRRATVERADASRSAVERELHDCVQSSLVGLIYELTRVRAVAAREDDRSDRFATDAKEVADVTARLRDLSHGIYPAILDASGIEAALWALTDDAPMPVAIAVRLDTAPSLAAQRVAYVTVAAAVGQASASLDVALETRGDDLALTISGIDRDPPARVADRVGAIEGAIVRTDDGWEAVLPCAS